MLTQTGLDMDSLGKIWELADMDEDGNLDEAEFAVAMHLIKNSLDGIEPPDTLPDTMLPKQAAAAPPPIVGRKPAAPPPTSESETSPERMGFPPRSNRALRVDALCVSRHPAARLHATTVTQLVGSAVRHC